MNDLTQNDPMKSSDLAERLKGVQAFDPGMKGLQLADLGQVVQLADLMSRAGPMVPKHCQKNPGICAAITMRALHWGFDPFALAMESYQASQDAPVAYSAKVFTAALRTHGVNLAYRYEGSYQFSDQPALSARGNKVAPRKAVGDRRCIAFAEIDGRIVEYETPPLDMIAVKNSSLWHNDPDQQLAYYAGRGWARRYRGDVMMGAVSEDEVRDSGMQDITPKEPAPKAASRFQALAGGNPTPEPKAADAEEETEPREEAAEAPEPADHQEPSAETDQEAGATESGEGTEEAEPKIEDGEEGANAFPGSDAYTAGMNAAAEGADLSECPHEEGTDEREDWIGGYKQVAA